MVWFGLLICIASPIGKTSVLPPEPFINLKFTKYYGLFEPFIPQFKGNVGCSMEL